MRLSPLHPKNGQKSIKKRMSARAAPVDAGRGPLVNVFSLRRRDSQGMVPESHLHWLPRLADADDALRALGRIPDPSARIAEIARIAQHQLDFSQVSKLDRALARTQVEHLSPPGLQPLKLAWLSSSTVDHLLP